jgi:adenylate cyclase
VLFADIRGSTTIAEHMEPSAYAALLNRFYHVASEVLVRHDAIVDKLIGDEVMALFIPGVCGAGYKRLAAEAAVALLAGVGYRNGAKVWMPVGAAVNSGVSYVGNVGGEGTVDFTAVGDTVNAAARLASAAAAGEILLNEAVFAAVADKFPAQESRTMQLRGREAPVSVRVLRRPGATAPSN